MFLRSITTLLVIVVSTWLARPYLVTGPGGSAPGWTSLLLGFVLIAALLAGRIAIAVGGPRITGYLLLGVLVGPEVLGILSADDLTSLGRINGLAISIIALAAGGELKIGELRGRAKQIMNITGLGVLAILVVIAGAVLALQDVLPFTQGASQTEVVVIALVFGSIAIASSPSVAIAVINDTRSAGPVTRTVLAVTVLKDVIVIVFFAVCLAVGRALLSGMGSLDAAFLGDVAWEILGSLGVGALIGVILTQYLVRMGAHNVLALLGVALVTVQIADVAHLEVLLVSLATGFVVENSKPEVGDQFVRAVEGNSLLFYALFFTLAGAGAHIRALQELWPFVLLFVALRAGAIWGGTLVGARASGAEDAVRQHAWAGFVSQAGVTMGMVIIVDRAFPEWGGALRTLFIAMVAVHELVGPVLLQRALGAAGEVDKRVGEAESASRRRALEGRQAEAAG